MSATLDKREQALGWIFAGVLVVHILLLQPLAAVALTSFAVLLAGAVLRTRQVYLPGWLGQILLLLSAIAVVLAQGRWQLGLVGEMASIVGAMMLLRPLNPTRSLRFIFCLLIILIAIILKPYASVSRLFLIGDVAVLFVLAEQAFRPAEVSISLWVSLVRSLRVIVPVGLVVLGIFWFFPSLSIYSPPIMPGFSGGETLKPGDVAELAQSRLVAMTAHFDEGQPVPSAAGNYWRGQVLDHSEGLTWTITFTRVKRQTTLRPPPAPPPSTGNLRYSQSLPSNRGGIVPVLDHAIYIEAKRDGLEIVVQDRGSAVLSAVGAGALTLDVVSSMQRLTDPPLAELAQGFTNVPDEIRQSPAIAEIVAKVFPPDADTPGKLRALGHYLSDAGFRYTTRPGRISSLEKFLVSTKQGFCEHYAAATANLLRLAGVPTRVVTGYRGGEWNPYLRTITIRDSDAHAWVEAWDSATSRWLRFDPTDYVYPDLAAAIQREMDSARWPAYRRGWSYTAAVISNTFDGVSRTWDRLTSFEIWENTPIVLFIALVGIALAWLIRSLRSRRASGSAHENAARLLADLERRAARFQRDRKPGETPLAWLFRLEQTAPEPAEKEALRHLATAYETGMYKPGTPGSPLIAELRQYVAQLTNIWKNHP